MLATASTVGSGGVLTPSLFIGAAVGTLFGGGLQWMMPRLISQPVAFGVIGMGGFPAATTQAPLTSILMIIEMTVDDHVVRPWMLTCATAYCAAKIYRHGNSVYTAMLVQAIVAEQCDDWRVRTVEALMKPAALAVPRETPLAEVFDRLSRRSVRRVYVTDGEQRVSGFRPKDGHERLRKGVIGWAAPVESIAEPLNAALSPQISLSEALDTFLREQARTLAVTPGQWRYTLLGEVSRDDVLLAIRERLAVIK